MYIIYIEGELSCDGLETIEAVKKHLAGIKADYIADEMVYRDQYPEDYTCTPEESWEDYFRDVYSVQQELDSELFL